MAEHPGHSGENDWDEVGQFDLPSGQRVVIETRTENEAEPDVAAMLRSQSRQVMRERVLFCVNLSASVTYLSLCLVALHRIFSETHSVGFKLGCGIGIPLFVWAAAICWFGTSALVTNADDGGESIVILARAAGVLAMIPALLFARAIVWGS
jgi:hypothetical protein